MSSLYPAIRDILAEAIGADASSVALFDRERKRISFPFVAGRASRPGASRRRARGQRDPKVWREFEPTDAASPLGYVLRTKRPQLWTRERMEKFSEDGKLAFEGRVPTAAVGAPMLADGSVIGAVEVRSYRKRAAYSKHDLQLLTFAAQQLAAAHTRIAALEETRQRNAELALVNEVGSALARQLDLDAIIELIGLRVASIFGVKTSGIALYDETTKRIQMHFAIDKGDRVVDFPEPWELGNGLSSILIRTRRPLRLNRTHEATDLGAIVVGDSEKQAESWLGVPILAGERVIGGISVERDEPYGFSESDEQLLVTLASSMGVALENARLFDETMRLLAETHQRNAELAVMNEIGSALARQLD
ncbi:MAG TPA: GAF domain-containing protein, partial [Candidatus Limnocylindrales bacterium]|nr:GAF domain-containing protein [Candidatus Limnocylindrales bacterium]